MKTVTVTEVEKSAAKYRGRLNRVYIHWTASRYDQVFGDYHFCIKGDGTIVQTTDNLAEVLAHTWHRNTGAIGIALSCALDAKIYADGSFDLGTYPPTPKQIEVVAQLMAALSNALRLPLTKDYFMTHSEIADIDGYGPAQIGTPDFDKWDLWQLIDSADNKWHWGGNVLRGKAIFYQNK